MYCALVTGSRRVTKLSTQTRRAGRGLFAAGSPPTWHQPAGTRTSPSPRTPAGTSARERPASQCSQRLMCTG